MKNSKKVVSLCLMLAFLTSFCTFYVAEAAVDTLTATDVGADYITIEWPEAFHGGVNYKVSADGGANWVDVADATSHTFRGLLPGQEYNVGVLSLNSTDGWINNGVFISVRTQSVQTPYAAITGRKTTSLEITLYNVEESGVCFISSVTDDGQVALEETQFTGAVFLDENLQPKTRYTYTIYAADESFDDIVISGSTLPEYKIETTEVTDTSVSLSWVQKEGSVSTHKLMIKTNTPGAFIPEKYRDYSDVEGTSVTITGLTPDAAYLFEVVPLNASWVWMDAYKIEVKTKETTQAYALIAERKTNSLTVELYNADPDGTYFITAEKEDGTVVLDRVEFQGTRYIHTELDADTTYHYTVENASGTVHVAIDGKTMPVYRIDVKNITETSVSLEWSMKEGCNGNHRILVTSSTPGANIPLKYVDDNLDASIVFGTKVTIAELTPGAAYTIRVTPVDSGWVWMEAYYKDIVMPTSVAELEAVRITATEIEIRWPQVEGASYYRVTLEDSAGSKTVLEERNTTRSLTADGLKIGENYRFYVDAFDENDTLINSKDLSVATLNPWNRDKGDQWYEDYTNQHHPGNGVTKHDAYYSAYMSLPVGFNIYLPADYEENTAKTYPVIYRLHGLGGDENTALDQWGDPYVNGMKEQQELRDMAIVVYVNNANFGWYTDSIDGTMAAESTIINELIPYVDANYRTNPTKSGRALDGFSMGGYGAFRLAFKYPELFGSAVSYAGGFAKDLNKFTEMGWTDALKNIFGYETDPALAREYYSRTNAYALLDQNIDAVKASGIKLRMIVGEDDFSLEMNNRMKEKLTGYGLLAPEDYIIQPGFDHNSPYYGQFGVPNLYWYQGKLSGTVPEPADTNQIVLKTAVIGESGAPVCRLLPGEKLSFTVSIANNRETTVEKATVYIKIQNQDDPSDLYILKSNSVDIAGGTSANMILSDVTLGAGDFYDITYYVWDGGMKPYTRANKRISNNF